MKTTNKEKLIATRKELGLSRTKAAELSNTAYSTWESWEKPEGAPGSRRVPGIALSWLNLYKNIKNTRSVS